MGPQTPFRAIAYDTATQRTTGYSPFFLVYGRPPSSPPDTCFFTAPVSRSAPSTEQFISRVKYCRQLACDRTTECQQDRTERYNDFHQTVDFRHRDELLLWTPLRVPGLSEKFVHNFLGPYTILEKTSPVNFSITPIPQPADHRCRGTEIVHVSRLKPFHRRPCV